MPKILRVNMTDKTTKYTDVPAEYQGLGGRGLTSTIVAKEVDPMCHPLSAENKLVFATGLLGGTNCANSGRISVGAKSPLTGGIKEANSGGQFGGYMGKLDLLAIVVEGVADGWWQLFIDKDKVELKPADDLAGLGNYDTVAKLTPVYGEKAGYCTIGQAGEYRGAIASIAFTDRELRPARHAGRGGLGAVMGSKGLKAMIIDPAGAPKLEMADPEAFKAAAKRFAGALSEHPVTSGGLPTYGTDVLINILNEAGGLPTRNFSEGRFEGAEKVGGETLNEITVKRGGNPTHGCMTGCMIRCSGIYVDENGKYVSKWPEYETVWAWGPNCGIDDLDAIARIDYMCDDFGIDTIDAGCAMAVLMDSGFLSFGDAKGAEEIMAKVGQGKPLGRILASGTEIMGKVFGVSRVPVVKGQSLPAYDPRAVKGLGVTYATTPMGADHTAGYATTANIMSVGGYVDPLKPEGQMELSQGLQVATAVIDTVGLCLFVAFAMLDIPDANQAVTDMVNARFGLSLNGDDVGALGQKVLSTEVDFNRRAGFNELHDRLPRFFETESFKPHGVVFDVPHEHLDKTLAF